MEIFFVAKRAFRKASVGVLTRETSYPEARETSAELMVSSSVMIVTACNIPPTRAPRTKLRSEKGDDELPRAFIPPFWGQGLISI
jgi:hypothetical protein